jgi:hypothetical protein
LISNAKPEARDSMVLMPNIDIFILENLYLILDPTKEHIIVASKKPFASIHQLGMMDV